MMKKLLIYLLIILCFLIITPATLALNGINFQVGAGWQNMSFSVGDNGSIYEDSSESLVYFFDGEINVSKNVKLIGSLNTGETINAETINSAPLTDLSGNYMRESVGLIYELGKNQLFKLGVGAGVVLDSETFTWIGDNDNQGPRNWEWQRSGQGLAGILGAKLQTSKLQIKTQFIYVPNLNYTEITQATKSSTWEKWVNTNNLAQQMQIKVSLELDLLRKLGFVAGYKYNLTNSSDQNVNIVYTDSAGGKAFVYDVKGDKTLEKGGLMFLGLKAIF